MSAHALERRTIKSFTTDDSDSTFKIYKIAREGFILMAKVKVFLEFHLNFWGEGEATKANVGMFRLKVYIDNVGVF